MTCNDGTAEEDPLSPTSSSEVNEAPRVEGTRRQAVPVRSS